MILAAGSFRLSGTPGLVVWRPRSQAVRMIALFMNGSPGPATIEGVNGNRVVIQQGLGYETYDEVTGAVGRADNKGDPTG